MNQEKKSRNLNLDIMRLAGVMIIMIAHASPPDWLFQIRNFGTPLLIVASALTYSVIYQHKPINSLPFLKKRLGRLCIPAWMFLTIFFSLSAFATLITGREYPFEIKEIIASYAFYNGIGFVWILKVYIILAFLTPLALYLRSLDLSNLRYFTALLIFYTCYEIALSFQLLYIPTFLLGFLNNTMFVVLPYAALYLYGFKLDSFSNRTILLLSASGLLLFTFLAGYKYYDSGVLTPTQEYKYPPTIYYLSYAFFALNLIYYFCRKLTISRGQSIIIWLSSNSLWIYLWHILAFYVWEFLLDYVVIGFTLFVVKTLYMLSFGMLLTYAQVSLVKRYFTKDSYLDKKVRYVFG